MSLNPQHSSSLAKVPMTSPGSTWAVLTDQNADADADAVSRTIDFFALWALSATPLLEDMKRRGWYKSDSALDQGLYASLMLTPVLGACTWLAIRPPLQSAAAAAADAAPARAEEEEVR